VQQVRFDVAAYNARRELVFDPVLSYSTYLGGSSRNPASGDVLVTGRTFSTDFPTVNPLQPANGGEPAAFISRLSPSPAAWYYVYPDSGQVQAGVPLDFYVFALDAQFNLIPDYTGLILFYAPDPQSSRD
jgi:hypothetical protein